MATRSIIWEQLPDASMKIQKVREPRWPAFIAMIADGLIYFALPDRLSVGPRWLLFAIIFALLIPIIFSYHRGRYDITRNLTFVAIGTITLALIGSLGLLIEGLPHHKDPPKTLLISAVLLWLTNVLVFALWYWKLDAGGPLGRDEPGGIARKLVSFSPDDAPVGSRQLVVAQFSGLSVSGLQHQHRIFSHRHGSPGALGQGDDDDAIADFAFDHRPASCARGQCALSNRM